MVIDPQIFRDYDIRALVPGQLDVQGVRKIARAIVKHFKPENIQVGRDMRLTSPEFHKALIEEFLASGVSVVDLGLTSTDMLYFAAGKYNEDLAINVSASHNPPQYNGLKIVKKGAVAVGGNSGIYDIKKLALAEKKEDSSPRRRGVLTKRNVMSDFVEHGLSYIQKDKMEAFKVVVDAGNAMAGHFMPQFEKHLPWSVTRLYYELDGSFPNHIPSPIEEKNMRDCKEKVKAISADVGMAFDGDGDRVFLVDETGKTVTGTIMTAIIAENLLLKNPGETILYNAIVGRVVPEVVKKHGGKPIRVRVGHTLIKEAMRKQNALFCGEHSGHYYFRDNYFADSAIIAALLVLELMSIKKITLSQLAAKYDKYFASGEINFEVKDKEAVMQKIEAVYKPKAEATDQLDGITIWFKDWWFNVRPSNTEPFLRLNIETDTQKLLSNKRAQLVKTIGSLGGKIKE